MQAAKRVGESYMTGHLEWRLSLRKAKFARLEPGARHVAIACRRFDGAKRPVKGSFAPSGRAPARIRHHQSGALEREGTRTIAIRRQRVRAAHEAAHGASDKTRTVPCPHSNNGRTHCVLRGRSTQRRTGAETLTYTRQGRKRELRTGRGVRSAFGCTAAGWLRRTSLGMWTILARLRGGC